MKFYEFDKAKDIISSTSDANVFYINDFDDSTARNFCNGMFQAAEDPAIPIVIYIDSYGGQVHSVLSMISVIESVPNQIFTVALGKCMSAGAVLLSAGTTRFVAPHSSIMIHEISGGAIGNVNDNINSIKEEGRLNKRLISILARNCGYKNLKSFLKLFTNERRDVYLDAKQAIKFGIADHVGVPRIIKGYNWSLIAHKKAKRPVRKDK